ncbi:MAG: single-stranded DNA-binding protein [Salinibacterium sp.]|nr:MAG: single-stranded DNA-binding protein [Salinibacterium sp.]
MPDIITLTGLVGTTPRNIVTSEGLSITSFRFASTQRRFDRSQERWIDGDTNWYTITTFRQLALNTHASVKKGERVIVTGRLRIREWTDGDRTGTNVDIEADAVGHDLGWGSTVFSRSISTSAGASATPSADTSQPEAAPVEAAEADSTPADDEKEPALALPF